MARVREAWYPAALLIAFMALYCIGIVLANNLVDGEADVEKELKFRVFSAEAAREHRDAIKWPTLAKKSAARLKLDEELFEARMAEFFVAALEANVRGQGSFHFSFVGADLQRVVTELRTAGWYVRTSCEGLSWKRRPSQLECSMDPFQPRLWHMYARIFYQCWELEF